MQILHILESLVFQKKFNSIFINYNFLTKKQTPSYYFKITSIKYDVGDTVCLLMVHSRKLRKIPTINHVTRSKSYLETPENVNLDLMAVARM